MKKILTLFMCLSLVGLYSCSSDDDNDGGDTGATKVKLTAVFKYTKDGQTVASPYTTMYIYDTKKESPTDWVFNTTSHNLEKKDGTVVYPKYTFLSDINGKISEDIDNNISYVYVYVAGVDPSITGRDVFDTKGQAIQVNKTN